MNRAGFVLVGGASSRMGRDKALLPYGGATLVEHVAARVASAAGCVVLVGPPRRYWHLGCLVIPDFFRHCGPLGGLHAALAASPADWNLVVACDMPAVTAGFLKSLLAAAESAGADALVPAWPSGWLEPLCAVYRRELAQPLAEVLERGVRQAAQALAGLRVAHWPITEARYFENLNTPKEWARQAQRRAALSHWPLLPAAGAP
jgi:molybdopterin-guanine dinucleotide biosynthesis protein A